MLIALTDTFLLPKMTTRFCYNSPEPTRVSVMGCTGSTALNVNITATQAFCLISQCLGQIRQTPMFLGRKRRSLDDDQLSIDEVNQENENNLMIDDLTKSKSDEIPEIIEYNTDGVKQQFAIKKDVEATVIDLIGLDED
uniref:Uncharacterized protein n=1 Tax=Tetranychus urticae TaxID=32264 RepID=T1KN76_TETUR